MMKNKLDEAKELLIQNDYTCVVIKDDAVFVSKERGVKPLLKWHEDEVDLEAGFAADKVIGKAAAYIYVLLKIKEVYACVISRPAYEVFQKYNIAVSYDCMVDAIVNRTKTGFCPMETAVMNIDNPKTSLEAIKLCLKSLEKNS